MTIQVGMRDTAHGFSSSKVGDVNRQLHSHRFFVCLCDTYSNCLPGKPKLIKKCTVSSPPECNGCEDGYYSEVNGCAECSSPCRTDEEEVQKCLTEHDRICKPRGIDAVPIASSSPTTSTSRISSMEVISMSTKRHTVVPKTETERVNTDEVPMAERSSQAQGTRNKYLKIFIPVGVIIVVAIILICACCKMRKARRRKANDQDLLPFLRKGLDRFLRQLSIDDKKMISREISNSRQGYADWRAVLDKLNDPGLLEESRGWNARDEEININKFLAAYGEKEGSTVAGLIQAIRDAGLELSAEKLKKKLGSDGDGSSGNTDQ